MTLKFVGTEDLRLIHANASLTHLTSISDSSEAASAEEVEEAPALEKLKQAIADPDDETLKHSCEVAIASYLKQIESTDQIENPSAIEALESLQRAVVDAIEKTVSYGGHEIRKLDDCRHPCTCCYVIPSYIQEKVHQIDAIRSDSLNKDLIRPQSDLSNKTFTIYAGNPNKEPLISVYNAQNKAKLPGKFVASNQNSHSASMSPTASKALKAAQDVYQFWMKTYGLNSFDGKGTEIRSTVHFDKLYANAFWNGEQMVYGDGDDIFKNFTELSIVGHEFGHAVTGDKLNYEGEAGALNEHLSDVWGSLVIQYKNNQTVDQASWLIGEGTIQLGGNSYALRSMKAPGTAYHSHILGKDPQPDHYSQRYLGTEDEGGVHINSGIPNKAFCLFAQAQGGYAWQKAGLLWFLTLKTDGLIKPNCTMPEFAYATLCTALKHFPTDYKMHYDLINAWKAVGLA
ncbi:M4 family metallopeptidase [Candidatus Protochlamydia phocaeensis]|uniref:M4 family metallopeptidase n=1 Tax=Candidatus Protochlamydia phocaeensis TaxID=1414722 RepID=UPI000838EFF9|nr:M4 family metallopeptidase [Candidatus Protochlamydia phocaeensis]